MYNMSSSANAANPHLQNKIFELLSVIKLVCFSAKRKEYASTIFKENMFKTIIMVTPICLLRRT